MERPGRGPDEKLRSGTLGTLAITFFVVSAAGPLVAMAGGVPVAMQFGNGAGTPALFIIAMAVLILFAAGYTAMARHIVDAGAFYAFAREGLGRGAGGATGLIALASYNAMQVGIYGMFGSAADALLAPIIGLSSPWWFHALAAAGTIAILGYRQIDLSARILGLLVIGEYLVVLILDAAIIRTGGAAGLSVAPFIPAAVTSGAPLVGLMLCFSAFVGFEATTIYSEEAKDPDRSVRRATYLALIVIGGFYALSSWAVVVGLGADGFLDRLQGLGDPTHLIFQLSDLYVGHGLTITMRILFVTSIFASLLAFHNAIARYIFATARDGLLPHGCAATHPLHRSPHIGSALQSGFAIACILLSAIAGADPVLDIFTLLTAVGTEGVLLLMTICSAAIFAFFARRDHRHRGLAAASALALILLGLIVGLSIIRFDVLTGGDNWRTGILRWLLPLVAAIGFWLGRRRRSP